MVNCRPCKILALFLFIAFYQYDARAETITGKVRNSWIKKFPTVVYVDEVQGMTFTPSRRFEMDQRNKEFTPRVLPVLMGSTVNFLNSDDIKHNIMSPDGERFDLGSVGKGVILSHTFNNPGAYTILCRVHPEMIGYVVVVKTPYFAVTDSKGDFKLEDVPPGRYTLKLWGEKLKQAQLHKTFPVTVGAGKGAFVEVEP
ncbi:MAG: hypothetical protein Q6354_10050 [Candidatus Brocadiales bacterium]|nr:hypothetical protein [Candidatus Brocadiales bacterium]